ncbi:trypsin-like serine peptidase [Ovoidimarina sediminis]|uniref:trypsin-like serine peptidase n=1 Tax=Ovoidimarina sediminis TaxID=3079856 RepID=UPI002908445E|nr:serine protease [Rhodophyticola sp. MJ-SS7]MDU8943681.1 serine protease [Rhodophyticola sp. MJ-SS7]
MRLLAGLALALGLSPAEARGPEALTDRSDILGWEAVGRLQIGERGACSGALIAPLRVLTAAHCVFDPETGDRLDPTEIVFHAGYRDGETIASAFVARAAVLPEFKPDDEDIVRYLTSDIALLELAEPIPATTASPYRVSAAPGQGAQVTAISYGHGRENTASREAGCRIVAKGSGVLVFDCTGIAGSSGGPIFDTSGRSPRIISLISGGGPYQGQQAVFGAELPGAIARLERAFRTGEGVWPDKALPEARRIGGAEARNAGSARFVRP